MDKNYFYAITLFYLLMLSKKGLNLKVLTCLYNSYSDNYLSEKEIKKILSDFMDYFFTEKNNLFYAKKSKKKNRKNLG